LNDLNVLNRLRYYLAIERLEPLERLEPATLKVFTLNFEPGTLNGVYPINVLNRLQYSLAVERLERFEPLERLERVQFTLNFEPGTLNEFFFFHASPFTPHASR
jgi:hypothetical protein